MAAGYGHTDIVQVLLTGGADVNAKSNDGGTALMRAKKLGHKKIGRILKEAGAKK
jgi:ankyrin repeat protein